MIAISLQFLAGRFHATPWGHHVNEGVVEWPPSPWRLLRALVATFYRTRPAGLTEEQLRRILGALASAPAFRLPDATVAHTRHYDVANGSVKFFDTFVVLNPSEAVICVWPDAELTSEDRDALSSLLISLGVFGRAESWCEAALLAEDEVGELNSLPFVAGQSLTGLETVRVLMPEANGQDLFAALLTETSAMRKQKKLDADGSRWVTYTRRSNALSVHRAAPPRRLAPTSGVTVARYALNSTVLPLVTGALPFAEQVRRALIRRRIETSHSEAITGKTRDGAPLAGHAHAHYFVTDEDGDGRLDHVTVYAPCGFSREDVEALGALRTICRSGNRPAVRMVLTGLGDREGLPGIPIFAASRRWRSVTPFSLPRFARRGAGKPPRPRDLPEAQLRRELRVRGLPEAVAVKRIGGYEVNDRPPVRWLDFHARRFKGEEGHGLAGFEIEFAEAVRGPISLGFASHFSLGLFAPCDLR